MKIRGILNHINIVLFKYLKKHYEEVKKKNKAKNNFFFYKYILFYVLQVESLFIRTSTCVVSRCQRHSSWPV